MRIDPVLGALAPALAAPSYMATQVEVLKSERVASRAVKMLGVERSPAAVAQWREATQREDSARALLRRPPRSAGSRVEPSRGQQRHQRDVHRPSDPIFAQAAANAFAQAYMDVSVDLRVAPARQSAAFLDEQTKVLRANLEKAQATLSKFQQDKGIVVTDERLDQENAPLRHPRQLSCRWRRPSRSTPRPGSATRGGETSPDVLQSGSVQGLKAQLAAAETRLTEVSGHLGKNHPARHPARGADRRAEAAARGRDPARLGRRVGHQAAAARRRSAELQAHGRGAEEGAARAARRPRPDRRLPCATSRPRSAPTTRQLSA